jgi:hypothetical protein
MTTIIIVKLVRIGWDEYMNLFSWQRIHKLVNTQPLSPFYVNHNHNISADNAADMADETSAIEEAGQIIRLK